MIPIIIPTTSTILYACVTSIATSTTVKLLGTYIIFRAFKSNITLQYAEELGIYEAKKVLANNTYSIVENKFGKTAADVSSNLVNKFPEALEEAIVLDGLVFSMLGAPIIFPIIGATIAYDIRKAANEYFGKDAVVKNVGTGAIAGAIKYGIANLTLDKTTLFIGAVNNGLYEYFKPEVGDTVGNLDVIGLKASLFQIEGTDAILKKMLTEDVNLKSELLTTLKVTTLLSGSLWGFLQDKKLSELNFATLERVPNHYNKVCNDLIGQKCHDYVLMLTSEIKVVGIQKSESTPICYSNQTNFKDLDVCYINELAMPINKNLEIEHDEL